MNLANITDAAILTAFKNAAGMEKAGYTIAQGSDKKIFSVVKPGNLFGDFYTVDTYEGFEHCSCPQFAHAGFCKHQVFVNDFVETEATEAQIEEYFAAREL